MSGVYIEGLERPKDNGCYLLTVRYDADGEMCVYPLEKLGGYDSRDTKQDTPMYRVIDVPDHGRLIEASYFDFLTEDPDNDPEWDDMRISMRMLREYVKDTPTIIPADKEVEDDEV